MTDRVNDAVARATQDRDFAIRMQFQVEVARGKSPSRAATTVAYRSGLRKSLVLEIIATKPPAVRRLTNQEARA